MIISPNSLLDTPRSLQTPSKNPPFRALVDARVDQPWELVCSSCLTHYFMCQED